MTILPAVSNVFVIALQNRAILRSFRRCVVPTHFLCTHPMIKLHPGGEGHYLTRRGFYQSTTRSIGKGKGKEGWDGRKTLKLCCCTLAAELECKVSKRSIQEPVDGIGRVLFSQQPMDNSIWGQLNIFPREKVGYGQKSLRCNLQFSMFLIKIRAKLSRNKFTKVTGDEEVSEKQ